MSSATTIYFVRHGTTTLNLQGKWQGRIDSELAELGIDEAEREAAVLRERASFDAAYTSPLRRARRTCEILCEPHAGVVPVDAPALAEPSLGPLEGRHVDDILAEHGEMMDRLADAPEAERLDTAYFPGLETPNEVAARVRRFIEDDLVPRHAGQVVLLVTHSMVLQALLAVLKSIRYEDISMRRLAWLELSVSADGALTWGDSDGFRTRSVRASLEAAPPVK